MAKGTESKQIIFNALQATYPTSFWEDEGKILRIPMNENGEVVEIKVQLTAAKNVLGDAAPASAFPAPSSAAPIASAAETIEVTQEEKENVQKLLQSLGL